MQPRRRHDAPGAFGPRARFLAVSIDKPAGGRQRTVRYPLHFPTAAKLMGIRDAWGVWGFAEGEVACVGCVGVAAACFCVRLDVCSVFWASDFGRTLLDFRPDTALFITLGPYAMAVEGYDLMMLGILAAAAVLGYFKGIVWQIAWIAGIAASTFVAMRFAGQLAPFIGQPAPWNRLIAMLALYVGTSLVVWLLFRVVSGAIDAVHLSAFDHQLGLLLGIAKGALLCIVITFFAVTMAPAYRPQIVGSHSGRIVAEVMSRADEILPREVAEAVNPFVKQFEDTLRNGGDATQSPVAGQPSALAAIWEGVTSAAAWTGGGPAGQGGQQAGGGTAFGGAPMPAGWNAPAPAQPTPGFAPPPRPAASGFTAPAQVAAPAAAPGFAPTGPRYQSVAPQAPPQPFPVGAQSPLPIR